MKNTILLLALGAMSSQGSTLRIVAQNTFPGIPGSANQFRSESGDPLPTGTIVRLGYFSVSSPGMVTGPTTDGDLFDNFVEIDSISISLGIDGFGNEGTFSQTIELDDARDLPDTTEQRLQFGLRIFNGSSKDGSSMFNTVTSENWRFSFSAATPPPPASELVLDSITGAATLPTLVWEDGAVSAFRTTSAVPEPSTALSALMGLGLLLGTRRR